MNNIVAALGLTAIIILIISVFNYQAGFIIGSQNTLNSSDYNNTTCSVLECPDPVQTECFECNETECPEDTTPYPLCDSCCAEQTCEESVDCEECQECNSCCPECPLEANEQNCQQYCGNETVVNESNTDYDHIIFTEIEYDPPGTESEEEWIEIYNPTDIAINLTGWTVTDNTETQWSFPDGSVISPESYITIARDSDAFNFRFGCSPNIDVFTRSLNNNGDQLFLKDNEGNEIDFVAWESGYGLLYPVWDISADNGESVQRNDNQDTDSPSDWLSNQEPEPANC
jgi:hypothetical protein